jgi:hypothetical protein
MFGRIEGPYEPKTGADANWFSHALDPGAAAGLLAVAEVKAARPCATSAASVAGSVEMIAPDAKPAYARERRTVMIVP